MREIKFRAWHKQLKKIYDVEGLSFVHIADVRSLQEVQLWNDEKFFWELIKDVEIMQYTGLKDENEKEIYEGDIVDYYKDEDSLFEEGLYRVDFADGAFVLIGEEGDPLDISQALSKRQNPGYAPTHYKIVGNIYENPELLK